MRVLQLLPDTDDSPINLSSLRLHDELTRGGVEVRTLALQPAHVRREERRLRSQSRQDARSLEELGRSERVRQIVPVIAPSSHSAALFTELRRELRWPDLVTANEVVPLALTFRIKVPFVIRCSGSTQPPTDSSKRDRSHRRELAVAQVFVSPASTQRTAMGSQTVSTDGVQPIASGAEPSPIVIRTSLSRNLPSSRHVQGARRAAREQLNVAEDAVVTCEMDRSGQILGTFVESSASEETIPASQAIPLGASADTATISAAHLTANTRHELLISACDIVTPSRKNGLESDDCVPPALLDAMALGAVPIGWPEQLDTELFVDMTTVPDPTAPNATAPGSMPAFGRSALTELCESVRKTTRDLCDPDRIHREWSELLTHPLPSGS